jgi:hypothetical protein
MRHPFLKMLVTTCAVLPSVAAAGTGAADPPWWCKSGGLAGIWCDPNWLAAIGQCIGALITAGAAFCAYLAVRATRLAAKSQTQGQTVAALLTRYADPAIYVALQDFGRFMGDVVAREDRKAIEQAVKAPQHDPCRTVRERYVRVSHGEAESALAHVLALLGYHLPDTGVNYTRPRSPAWSWPWRRSQADAKKLIAHRRTIHHHFKLVWAALHAGVLAREHLRLVTEANYGYELWLTAALPVTVGMAEAQGRPLPDDPSNDWDVEWPWDLIEAVERAPKLRPLAPETEPCEFELMV